MNEMLLVDKTKVVLANVRLKELKEAEGPTKYIYSEGYEQCLKDLELLGYDLEKEKAELRRIREQFYGEEDDIK